MLNKLSSISNKYAELSSASKTILGLDVFYMIAILVAYFTPDSVKIPEILVGVVFLTNIPLLWEIKQKKLV